MRRRKTLKHQAAIESFRQAQWEFKNLTATEIAGYVEAAAGTNWLPRDLYMMVRSGNAYSLQLEDGQVYIHMTIPQEISDSLDLLADVRGSLLVRGAQRWQALIPANAGLFLQSNGPGADPTWEAAGGSAAGMPAPVLADFPTWLNQSDTVAENSPYGGISWAMPTNAATQNLRGRVKTLPSPPQTYTAQWLHSSRSELGNRAGIWIRDSTTGRLWVFAVYNQSADQRMTYNLSRWTGFNTFSSDDFTWNVDTANPAWLQIEDDGTDMFFRIGQGGAAWITLAQISRTAWLATPDQIGPVVQRSGSANGVRLFHFAGYEET